MCQIVKVIKKGKEGHFKIITSNKLVNNKCSVFGFFLLITNKVHMVEMHSRFIPIQVIRPREKTSVQFHHSKVQPFKV